MNVQLTNLQPYRNMNKQFMWLYWPMPDLWPVELLLVFSKWFTWILRVTLFQCLDPLCLSVVESGCLRGRWKTNIRDAYGYYESIIIIIRGVNWHLTTFQAGFSYFPLNIACKQNGNKLIKTSQQCSKTPHDSFNSNLFKLSVRHICIKNISATLTDYLKRLLFIQPPAWAEACCLNKEQTLP